MGVAHTAETAGWWNSGYGVYATGGNTFNYTQTSTGITYRVHEFVHPTSDDLVVTTGGTVEYIIAGAGGQGGGSRADVSDVGGGGGGGEVLSGTYTVTTQSYNVIPGFQSSTLSANTAGTSGYQSEIFGLIAAGGAGGGRWGQVGLSTDLAGNAAAGGGGSGSSFASSGGTGTYGDGGVGGPNSGGGGGGMTSNGTAGSGASAGGNGGTGMTFTDWICCQRHINRRRRHRRHFCLCTRH